MDVEVRLAYRERLWVEGLADPVKHIAMICMSGISECIEKIHIAVNPTDILRRARASASLNTGVNPARFGRQDCLDQNVVLPAITEVILVRHAVPGPPEHLIERRSVLAHAPNTEFRIRGSVEDSAYFELVKVAIGPAHNGLKGIVEPLQRYV